jgi:hypothetical protein
MSSKIVKKYKTYLFEGNKNTINKSTAQPEGKYCQKITFKQVKYKQKTYINPILL